MQWWFSSSNSFPISKRTQNTGEGKPYFDRKRKGGSVAYWKLHGCLMIVRPTLLFSLEDTTLWGLGTRKADVGPGVSAPLLFQILGSSMTDHKGWGCHLPPHALVGYFVVRIWYVIHLTYKICVNWLFILLVRLLVNNRLLVKFCGSQKLFVDFWLNRSQCP